MRGAPASRLRRGKERGCSSGTGTPFGVKACRLSPLLLVALLSIVAFNLASGSWPGRLACAQTFTDDDVRAMQRVYERKNRPMKQTRDAVFPIEVMKEPAVDPPVVARMLPYRDWEDEYKTYFQRHTGRPVISLQPTILVMHYTVCDTFETAWNVFTRGARMSAGDAGTVYGHPSVHFMIDRDGTIYQLLPLDRRATGTYGVNHCALQVEMVAVDEADLLNNPALLKASFRLARALTSRYHIPLRKVYAHADVSAGQSVVPEYLDLADHAYPTRYPASSTRTDPGEGYMAWLRYFLQYAPTR